MDHSIDDVILSCLSHGFDEEKVARLAKYGSACQQLYPPGLYTNLMFSLLSAYSTTSEHNCRPEGFAGSLSWLP